MVKNTNAVFWIICGAIFVTTVYLIIAADVPGMVGDLFANNKSMVETTDNGATPEKSVVKDIGTTADSFSVTYKKAKNASRYRCFYGEEKGNMKKTGVIYVGEDVITCRVMNLKPNTKYYVKMQSLNNDKKVESEISDLKTKSE